MPRHYHSKNYVKPIPTDEEIQKENERKMLVSEREKFDQSVINAVKTALVDGSAYWAIPAEKLELGVTLIDHREGRASYDALSNPLKDALEIVINGVHYDVSLTRK